MRWKQKIRLNNKTEPHKWFAWFPVNVAGHNAYPGVFIWLEVVNRQLIQQDRAEDYYTYLPNDS